MSQPDSPLTRSIGVAGVIYWLIVIAGVVAIGVAFSSGLYPMAIAGSVFLLAAIWLGIRASRARKGEG